GELVRSRPRLGLAQMWMAVLSGHIEAAGIALEAAERASADAAEEPFEPSVGRAASLLANVPAAIAAGKAWLAYLRGAADDAATFASQAHSKLDEGESMLNSVCQLELGLPIGSAAGSMTPSAASLPASWGGGRPVSAVLPQRSATFSAMSSSRRAAWTQSSLPIRWR